MILKTRFRQEIKRLLNKLVKAETPLSSLSDHPEVLALLDEWVEDIDIDLSVEDLETILQEEILKFYS